MRAEPQGGAIPPMPRSSPFIVFGGHAPHPGLLSGLLGACCTLCGAVGCMRCALCYRPARPVRRSGRAQLLLGRGPVPQPRCAAARDGRAQPLAGGRRPSRLPDRDCAAAGTWRKPRTDNVATWCMDQPSDPCSALQRDLAESRLQPSSVWERGRPRRTVPSTHARTHCAARTHAKRMDARTH